MQFHQDNTDATKNGAQAVGSVNSKDEAIHEHHVW